jgi:hypothetical protein
MMSRRSLCASVLARTRPGYGAGETIKAAEKIVRLPKKNSFFTGNLPFTF